MYSEQQHTAQSLFWTTTHSTILILNYNTHHYPYSKPQHTESSLFWSTAHIISFLNHNIQHNFLPPQPPPLNIKKHYILSPFFKDWTALYKCARTVQNWLSWNLWAVKTADMLWKISKFPANKGPFPSESWHRVRFCYWHSTYNTIAHFHPVKPVFHVCLAE